jgi:glycosyltransferase involved in cell wall biosynthesis
MSATLPFDIVAETSEGKAWPRITVITVCWNAATTIEKTLLSIAAQTYANVESVIVDGASTDNTLAIVQRLRVTDSILVSEKDRGIYDAMNKGIALATGDVLYFLNADDKFVDERVLEDVAAEFARDRARLLVYGNVRFVDAPGGLLFPTVTPFTTFTAREFIDKPFCHQAIFAHRRLFTELAPFDTRHRYAADYDWFARVFRSHPRALHAFDRDIAFYYYLGRSYTDSAITRSEKRAVLFRHLMSVQTVWYWFRYMLLRGWKKRLFREKW